MASPKGAPQPSSEGAPQPSSNGASQASSEETPSPRKRGKLAEPRGPIGYRVTERGEDEWLSDDPTVLRTRYFGLMSDRTAMKKWFEYASYTYNGTKTEESKQEMDHHGAMLDKLQERIDKLCERGGFRDDDQTDDENYDKEE